MANEPVARRLFYRGGYPVYLARYVIFYGDESYAALRFFNASEIEITGIRFRLTEKDGEGSVLSEAVFEREGLFAETGREFSVADAPVSKDCALIEVAVEAIRSGDYEYLVEGESVKLRYGAEEKGSDATFRHASSYSRSKRYKKTVVFCLVSVLLAVGLAVGLAFRFGFYSKKNQITVPERTSQTAQPSLEFTV